MPLRQSAWRWRPGRLPDRRGGVARPATYPPDGRPSGRIRPRIVLAQQARAGYHAVRLYLSGAHGTLVYLFALTVAWWTLRGADPRLVHRLLISQSTNLHNMTHDPFQVLVASAFWIDGKASYVQLVAGFLLVVVPAERWLGTGRWVLTFAAGHAGATLVTVIGYAVSHGLLNDRIARASDVGGPLVADGECCPTSQVRYIPVRCSGAVRAVVIRAQATSMRPG